jgi:cyclohexanone monooxygenase
VIYAEHCAQRFGLRNRVRFGTKITAATFDEERHRWELETDRGDVITVRHVVDATGILTQPKLPEIEGVETFAGVTMHTARWDHEQSLTGKRVAVIGTGASAVQLIPAIAPDAEHLTVFQRTPIWCLPKLDGPLPQSVRWFMTRVPGGAAAARLVSQSLVELMFPLTAHYHSTLRLGTAFESIARKYLREQIHDAELREKLTPRYSLGCKRPGFHNEYLATFNRGNVTLETDPIERITAGGVITRGGTEHDVDVLVHATGFKVFDPGNFPKYPVVGRGGLDLEGGGTRTVTRRMRASACRGSRTTSRCSARMPTTARPTSTSSKPRLATSSAPCATPVRTMRP